MDIVKEVTERFSDIIFDWDYKTYLLLGGYGSGKSYQVAFKLILKLLQEKRKALVVREVYDTITESCYDLIREILEDMDLLADDGNREEYLYKVRQKKAPMEYIFPNGSRIIFKGMDKPEKVKSINGVSIVWLEECSEIKYEGYKELLGRLRPRDVSMHFILSCNPVGKENWVYQHFFKRIDEDGNEIVILDDEELYVKKDIIKNGVYYHHSLPDDNPFLPPAYLKTLDDIQTYDRDLWRVARWGRFGANGTRVLPQFEVATNAKIFTDKVRSISDEYKFFGFDFGFEESYNAVIWLAVDVEKKHLYIYDEDYINNITDDVMAKREKMLKLKDYQESMLTHNANGERIKWNGLVADNEDPKAIAYYRKQGYTIRGCRNKFAGSRLSNTRKIKRFRRIICSPKCKNTIRELRDLTYKKNPDGTLKYDEFNIDPHTFSAIWYALDTYDVADLKERKSNARSGN